MTATTPAPNKAPPGRRAFAWLTAALLTYVSWQALRSDPGGSTFNHLDKLLHLGAFVSLAASSALALGPVRHHNQAWARCLGLAGVWLLYGGLIEVLQSFLPGREPSLLDLLADAAGIALGLTLALFLQRWSALKRLI